MACFEKQRHERFSRNWPSAGQLSYYRHVFNGNISRLLLYGLHVSVMAGRLFIDSSSRRHITASWELSLWIGKNSEIRTKNYLSDSSINSALHIEVKRP
jgi:hypothetical protein